MVNFWTGLQDAEAYLDWPIPFTCDCQPNPLLSLVQNDFPVFNRHNSTWKLRRFVRQRVWKREKILGRYGKEAPIERSVKIAIIGTDGIVDSDEVGAARERPLDHHLGEGRDDRRLYVTPSEHLRANGHEVGHRVVAISNELDV